jgi:hypothetical protein
MKKVFFALIFGLLANDCAFAQDNLKQYEEECLAIIEKPKIRLMSSYGKLRYNYEKDSAFLRKETEKMYKEQGLELPEEFEPMGLTRIRDGFEVKMEVGTVGVSHGYQCIYPESIDVFVGYYFPVVYIAKELAKESCMYDLTLRHEQVHLRIFVEALDYFLPKFKKIVNGARDKLGVKIVERNMDAKLAAEEYNDMYIKYFENIVNKWRKAVSAEQMKLDSVENYILEAKICEEEEEESNLEEEW